VVHQELLDARPLRVDEEKTAGGVVGGVTVDLVVVQGIPYCTGAGKGAESVGAQLITDGRPHGALVHVYAQDNNGKCKSFMTQ